jgi:hypothetical protein
VEVVLIRYINTLFALTFQTHILHIASFILFFYQIVFSSTTSGFLAMHHHISRLTTALLLFAAAQTVDCQGLFTVTCATLTIQRSDPIVNPGVASGHVHAVVGGTAFNRTETNAQAVNAATTTCNRRFDKSNYWVPQLYHINGDGTFGIVPLFYSVSLENTNFIRDLDLTEPKTMYYFNRACNYNQANYAAGTLSCDPKFNATAPPAGFRMLAGNPTLR